MFGPSGIVRVDRAFPADIAATITDLIWDVLRGNLGIDRNAPQTWGTAFRYRPLHEIGSAPIFDEILTDRLASTVDGLLGEGAWDWPDHWGDFLITFPNAQTWTLPHQGWHQDWPFSRDCEPPRFCKAFVFLNEVGPRGGGTLVVAGSHRLYRRFGHGRMVDDETEKAGKGADRLYRECDWLRDLCSAGDDEARRHRFMETETEVAGAHLKVIELTGQPGDVVLIHPWLVHAVAPNAADTPRFMRAPVFSPDA